MVGNVRLFLLILLLLVGSNAIAQALPDPTRPAVSESASEAGGVDQGGASNGLQTIVRRKGARPAAVINGALVKLGAKSGDSTLVKVGDDYVVLKSPAGTQILSLTPDIKKTATRRAKTAPTKGKKAEE